MGKRLGFDFFFFVGENGKQIMDRLFLRILSDERQSSQAPERTAAMDDALQFHRRLTRKQFLQEV